MLSLVLFAVLASGINTVFSLICDPLISETQ